MRGLRAGLAIASLALVAARVAIPSAPARHVTDDAGWLSSRTVETLDARLADYERQSGHQVVVYVGRTTGDTPVEEWAVRAFERWGVGRKGKDDGVGIFVFRDDRKARIEVGYGLEDRITDLRANRILDEQMLPRLRAGDPDGALTAGVEAILAGIEGRAPPASPGVQPGGEYAPEPIQIGLGGWIVIGILAVLFLVLLATHPSLALWLLWSMASGSRRGGGGGGGWGGGGFSGGGGRSGGGGATGSW